MSIRATRVPPPLASQTDTYWDKLTDAELLAVTWETDRPEDLPRLQEIIPAALGDFIIELRYDLDSERVRCGHCPGHTKHKHGFVLKARDGCRYLLGSICGPKYGADYEVASEARKRAHRRALALHNRLITRTALPDLVESLSAADRMATMTLARRTRGTFRVNAPQVLEALARLRSASVSSKLQLITHARVRNIAEEERRSRARTIAASEIGARLLTNKEHNRQIKALDDTYKTGEEVWEDRSQTFGTLPDCAWLLGNDDPTLAIEQTVSALRRLSASLEPDGLQTAEIEAIYRQISLVLERADAATKAAWGVQDFLRPECLSALGAWLEAQPRMNVKLEKSGDGFLLIANGTRHVLQLIRQPEPNEFSEAYQRWTVAKSATGQFSCKDNPR